MLQNSASCLVGVITIETLSADDSAQAAPAVDYDATLAQFLAHLANLPAEADGWLGDNSVNAAPVATTRRIDDARTGGRLSTVWVHHSRVVADLGNLRTELTRAVDLARRRIARSR